ncbi:uncharacterized protein LOC141632409 [Silene latifolia]|uniref:uncharacterized protein LOC141632409 n=1 Tax=Silene latifolia TaxID=37657 RepID=UPI003D77F5A9
MVKRTNPGSYAICSWVNVNSLEHPLQFKSIFIAFDDQIKGVIAGCRSLVGVDGTHLKGNHSGVLLTAVAIDGNNEMLPLAVSVVESENKDSWSNFVWNLKYILKDSGRSNWTIISDRQKGVEPALNTAWPEAYRRFFNATSEFTFKKALELVVQHGRRGATRWFMDLGEKEMWTKHMFDPDLSAENNTSNFVESFNSTLEVHRTNPILTLLEGIKRLAMVKDGRTYLPLSLNKRTCTCGYWQISSISCRHVIRAIIDAHKEPSAFVSE